MFRAVRKKVNEISRESAEVLLETQRRGVLSMNGEDGYPYAIPINFYYNKHNGKIYFHGSRAGYKIDVLKNSDKICFTVCSGETIKDEPWAPYVKSAVLFGRCRLIEPGDESLKLLKEFAMKYYPSEELVDEEIAHVGRAAQMFEITIEHITGKEVQEK